MLRHLDLFSGIGGFALAARMVGDYETVAFCELEPYCQAVLRKHWPGVPIYDDVRSVQRVECDIITGGFPCQPFSAAGTRLGREDDRHLWPEYRRIVEASRPAWVLGENVPGIVGMELDNVLADLESIGYACATFSVPACAVGARHIRERIWIVAYTEGGRWDDGGVAQPRKHSRERPQQARGCHGASYVGDPLGVRQLQQEGRVCDKRRWIGDAGWWESEPGVGRVAHGIPARVDRLRGLGNAIVPQVAAIFLQAIKDASELSEAQT